MISFEDFHQENTPTYVLRLQKFRRWLTTWAVFTNVILGLANTLVKNGTGAWLFPSGVFVAVTVGLLVIVIGIQIVFVVLRWRLKARVRAVQGRLCPRCCYPRDEGDKCPECGLRADPDACAASWQWWLGTLI